VKNKRKLANVGGVEENPQKREGRRKSLEREGGERVPPTRDRKKKRRRRRVDRLERQGGDKASLLGDHSHNLEKTKT